MNRAQHLRSRLHGSELRDDLLSAFLGTANEAGESFDDAPEANHKATAEGSTSRNIRPLQARQKPAQISTNGLFRLQEQAFRIAA